MEKLKPLCTVGDKMMHSHYGNSMVLPSKKLKISYHASLEKEKATHSSTFALKNFSWTKEPTGVTIHGVTKSQDMTEHVHNHEIQQPCFRVSK